MEQRVRELELQAENKIVKRQLEEALTMIREGVVGNGKLTLCNNPEHIDVGGMVKIVQVAQADLKAALQKVSEYEKIIKEQAEQLANKELGRAPQAQRNVIDDDEDMDYWRKMSADELYQRSQSIIKREERVNAAKQNNIEVGNELDTKETDLMEREQKVTKREEAVTKREEAVTKREEAVASGTADKLLATISVTLDSGQVEELNENHALWKRMEEQFKTREEILRIGNMEILKNRKKLKCAKKEFEINCRDITDQVLSVSCPQLLAAEGVAKKLMEIVKVFNSFKNFLKSDNDVSYIE